ncbi:uncharacterized protein J4E79_011157 [Alternaria viburni]|uniref:uncharacterized protein n=1 Tax=Alternaria viburni TaxID=566460 RepID=UPI0020C375A9|nr:uncharacterized protein J4E79_011157 [Alternaria viburni]KAI4643885.1 hypothetical protein J4E79_011157 [Alternaria viburni]
MALPTRTEFYRDHLAPCRILPGTPKFADIGICVVCQEDFNDASYDMVAVKSCSHVFHRKCIIQWTETWGSPRDKCPSCREAMYQYTPMTTHEIQAMQEAQAIQDAESRLSELGPYAAAREAERLWFASMGVSVEDLPAFDDMTEPTHFSDDDGEEIATSWDMDVNPNMSLQVPSLLPKMSPSNPLVPTTSVSVDAPRSRPTSLDEVAPMTPRRRYSNASDSSNDDDLDDLFEDETTWGLSLPPIPKSSPISSPDDTHVAVPQKRKRDSATTDDDASDDASDDSDDSPLSKKARSADEETDKKNTGKESEATRRYRTLATAASLKPSTNNANKFLDSMRKQRSIPTPRYVPTGAERRSEVNELAAKHVQHVAPAMLANNNSNRDVGGAMTKFDWAEKNREIKPDQIKTPAYALQKWVDADDEHITWFVIPASHKYINTGSTMVPIADIVDKSIMYPEWTFVEEVLGPHWKTGVAVVKAVKVKYEKLTDEQSLERMEVMVKQKEDEVRQARKDEAARRRMEKREERARARDEEDV